MSPSKSSTQPQKVLVNTINMKLFNKNLELLRGGFQLSQDEIARVMGITPTMVDSIEKGDPNLNCKALTLLCRRYPDLNLNWFIKGQGYPLSSERPPAAAWDRTVDESLMVRFDRGNYENALIEFLDEKGIFSGELSREEDTQFAIFRHDQRQYLVMIYEERDEVIKEHVARRLWIAPDSLLRYNIVETAITEQLLQIASYFREHKRIYVSPLLPPPRLAVAFNKVLELQLHDKDYLIDRVYDKVSDSDIFGTDNAKSYSEVEYEESRYLIYDVTW
jgi:transcriptional regulator with XRE-family HTH domain